MYDRAWLTKWLQKDLGLAEDGVWGPATDAAVKQKAKELNVQWKSPVPTNSPRINWHTYNELRCEIRKSNATAAPATPTPSVATPATTTTTANAAVDACSNGQVGTCINIYDQVCIGAETIAGACPGPANNRCCPSNNHASRKTVGTGGLIAKLTSTGPPGTFTSGNLVMVSTTTPATNATEAKAEAGGAADGAGSSGTGRKRVGGGAAAAISLSLLIVAALLVLYTYQWRKDRLPALPTQPPGATSRAVSVVSGTAGKF